MTNDLSPAGPSGQEDHGSPAEIVRQDSELPPILAGRSTPEVKRRLEQFYASVAEIFETWVTRRKSLHTQDAYRRDVMSFVRFMNIPWPEDSWRLFVVSVRQVQAWRDVLVEKGAAPKTLVRRVSSLGSFFKYLAIAAGELRLPITVPNPAHAQFISRGSTDAREETRALTATRARQLMGLPAGETLIEARDRAILKFYLYTGARISTGIRLRVSDFHQDGDEATIRLHEKGDHRRTIGLHFAAAQAISEYLERGQITSGPLFRPQLNPRSKRLSTRHFSRAAMYKLILDYLKQLPGALKERTGPDNAPEKTPEGVAVSDCIYTPHSLRATTATLLLDAEVDIRKVQELLGHRHITTTQIYDKRRISTKP